MAANNALASATAGDSEDDEMHWSMAAGIVEAGRSLQSRYRESCSPDPEVRGFVTSEN